MAIIKTIEDCCSPMFLEFMKYQAQESENWHMKYPRGADVPFEKKHLKLELLKGTNAQRPENNTQLGGMAMSLLLQIYEKEPNYFYPEVLFCGISLKDRHREDNYHTDHVDDALKDQKIVKLLGVLNSDWDCKVDGGGFTHGGETYPLVPCDFILFDPRVTHRADDILSDKKRIAIDFTLKAQ